MNFIRSQAASRRIDHPNTAKSKTEVKFKKRM